MITVHITAKLLSVCLLQFLHVSLAKEASTEFKIVPGREGSVSVALDTPPIPASTCSFEWATSGATTELWAAKISGDPRSGEMECEISRRGGTETYLLFSKFRTTLGTSPVLEAVIHGNDGELESEHFETDGECVENSHTWGGGTIRRISLKSMFVS